MKKLLPILAVPFAVILLFFSVLVTVPWLAKNGTLHGSTIQDFAVSSDGTVFVGYFRVIEAYKDGSLAFTFRPPTTRAYRFYIEDDKLIVASSSGNCKIYDTKGNYIEDGDLSYEEVKSTAKKKEEYTSENGDVYKLHRFLQAKPFEIRRNNETIIKESALDYHVHELPFHVLFCLTFISMLFILLAALGTCQREEFWGVSSPPWIGSNYD